MLYLHTNVINAPKLNFNIDSVKSIQMENSTVFRYSKAIDMWRRGFGLRKTARYLQNQPAAMQNKLFHKCGEKITKMTDKIQTKAHNYNLMYLHLVRVFYAENVIHLRNNCIVLWREIALDRTKQFVIQRIILNQINIKE